MIAYPIAVTQNASYQISGPQRAAILDAESDAAAVLNGRITTDNFVIAKETAQAVLKTRFNSDREAAVAILEFNTQLR